MNKWAKVRKELNEQIKKDVQLLLGNEDPEIQSYRKDFEDLFLCKWKDSQLKELFEKIQEVEMVYLSDFHAIRQSQRSHLRILRQLPENQAVFIAMECFSFENHEDISKYLSGEIEETDFLKRIRWDNTWGFPWEHYKPILQWAQERIQEGKSNIWIYGINPSPYKTQKMTLKERDQFSAEILLQIKSLHSDDLGVVIIGEMHLTNQHLLGEVRALGIKNDLVVYQNSDEIYFRLLSKKLEHKINVLKKPKANEFCLITSPPWVKWQNYLMYLEQQYDQTLDEEIDYTDHVFRYYKILCHDFQIENPKNEFSIESASDSRVWAQLQDLFSRKTLIQIEKWIETSSSFYIPELHMGFIGNPSVNHAAEIAMMVLHCELGGYNLSPFQMPQSFLELIWIESIRYVGVKWINPQRKTDTLKDIQLQIKLHSSRKFNLESLQLSLYQKTREIFWISDVTNNMKTLSPFKPRLRSSYFEAARILGGIMGEKIHLGLKESLLSIEELLLWMSYPIADPKFKFFYKEVIQRLHRLPEPFSSKQEIL